MTSPQTPDCWRLLVRLARPMVPHGSAPSVQARPYRVLALLAAWTAPRRRVCRSRAAGRPCCTERRPVVPDQREQELAMDTSTFRFRESEVESLQILLGDFGLLEPIFRTSTC